MNIAEINPIIGILLVVTLIGLLTIVVICDKNQEANERELKRKQPLL